MYGKTTLSALISVLPFVYFYESTGNEYYLRKLQVVIDQIIDSSWFRASADIGTIIYCPQYWIDGAERDFTAKITMFAGVSAVKLYQWIGQTKYKTLADRIASESLQLVVVNNSTDMAWSWAYYLQRTEANAKMGVNRQGSIAYFYAVYGNVINSTYMGYVPKIVNWIWRAQQADNGLAYSMDSSRSHAVYSAYSLYFALNSYYYASGYFGATLKTKMNNTLTYLQNGTYGQSPLYYANLYVTGSAYILAVKTGFLSSPTQNYLNRTKTIIYTALQAMNVRERGFHVSLDDFSCGYRWFQFFVGAFFSTYPFTY